MNQSRSPQLNLPTRLISRPLFLTQAAVIAAAYIVLTFPFASFAFGPIQFRLSEALTVLAALTPAAIPGLFLGCLLTNAFFNPSPLGPIDVTLGSLATLAAAFMTWYLAKRLLSQKSDVQQNQNRQPFSHFIRTMIVLMPAVGVNGLVVGTYLPFLIPEVEASAGLIISFMLSIAASEAFVVYVIGWPLMIALQKTRLLR